MAQLYARRLAYAVGPVDFYKSTKAKPGYRLPDCVLKGRNKSSRP